MVWCGFDESMRTGIVKFASGVADAIFTKAQGRGVSVHAQLDRERHELNVLERMSDDYIDRLKDSASNEQISRLRAFVGLVSVARYLIEHGPIVRRNPDGGPDFYPEAHFLGSLIKDFDETYERQPSTLSHEDKIGRVLVEIFGTGTPQALQAARPVEPAL